MGVSVETETQVAPSPSGTGGVKMLRHIVAKGEAGVADAALCGALWDRLNPRGGEVCTPCVELYKKMRPGWPIPGWGL